MKLTNKAKSKIVANMVGALYGKLGNKEVQNIVSKSLDLTPLETMRVWDVIQAESLTKLLGL